MAVEVSTAGLRKPVGEVYPAPALAEMLVDAGAAFSLSSDAHVPEHIGWEYGPTVEVDALVGDRGGRHLRAKGETDGAAGMSARVGVGYDSHRFAAGRRLVLGGVEIDHDVGLEGHSDADVLTHAVIDAVLGAAGLGDLGNHFPPSDERWRDADSLDLLRTVLGEIRGTVANVDVTVVCERPAIGPHRAEMERLLGETLGRPRQRQGDHERGDGMDRPRRGHRRVRRRPPRRGLTGVA